MPITNTESGALGGAASGAAAGFSVGGPLGAVIGGVAGGLLGGLGGSKADAAQRALAKAAKWEARSKGWEAATARRDVLRQARIQQAMAMAYAASEEGGLISSGFRGARGSSQSQLGFNLNYMDMQSNAGKRISQYLSDAGVYTAQANTYGALLALGTQAASAIGQSIQKTPPSGYTPVSPSRPGPTSMMMDTPRGATPPPLGMGTPTRNA